MGWWWHAVVMKTCGDTMKPLGIIYRSLVMTEPHGDDRYCYALLTLCGVYTWWWLVVTISARSIIHKKKKNWDLSCKKIKLLHIFFFFASQKWSFWENIRGLSPSSHPLKPPLQLMKTWRGHDKSQRLKARWRWVRVVKLTVSKLCFILSARNILFTNDIFSRYKVTLVNPGSVVITELFE